MHELSLNAMQVALDKSICKMHKCKSKARIRVRYGVKFTLRCEQQTLKGTATHSTEDHCANTHSLTTHSIQHVLKLDNYYYHISKWSQDSLSAH